MKDVTWRKSSRSGSSGGQCVEVASMGSKVAVRDSKDPDGPVLVVARPVLCATLRDLIRR
ncbi:DUF397 domain-containing protein [Actinomadura sp. KC06]|uniref:DUF397 domain-containing protein n=1 Tax=Actinomadura sp. KC06 TaxID=2530369 RepID=UPI00104418A0|nr:DUF397 domain-containing protein [Actinomadura sp. KC06]TDD33989.1 DUF397 domain-containing protein [Actinomadura sp. KC06]